MERKFLITFAPGEFEEWKKYLMAEGYIGDVSPDSKVVRMALEVSEAGVSNVKEVKGE